jgi:hypothetical protein
LLRSRSTHIFSITFQKLQRFCAGFGSRMSCETSQQQQIFQYEPKTSDFTEWHMKKFSQVSDVLCNDLSIESTIVQTCTRMPFRFEINHVIHIWLWLNYDYSNSLHQDRYSEVVTIRVFESWSSWMTSECVDRCFEPKSTQISKTKLVRKHSK